MYATNLSWNALQDILSSLKDDGLIDEVDASDGCDKRTNILYHLTEKGENVVKYFFFGAKDALETGLLKLDFTSERNEAETELTT